MKLATVLSVFGIFLALAAAAQDPKDPPAAGATTGQKDQLVPSPFRAYIVVDDRFPPKVAGSPKAEDRDPKNRTDKMHCLVCEHGLNPVVAVFVRVDDAKKITPATGVGKLAIEMNKLMTQPEYRGAKLAGFTIFLRLEGPTKSVTVVNPDKSQSVVELDAEYPDDEKRDDYARDIRDGASDIKAPNVVFGLAPMKSKSATAWGIADEDEVTVVVFNRIRVLNRWKFKVEAGPTDDEVKQIIGTVEESITGVKKP